jgi:hypothetical protein
LLTGFLLINLKIRCWLLISEFFIADTDDDSYRPSKRARADHRSSVPSDDDLDGMNSSPGRSPRRHSREDNPTTDQNDDDQYEVFPALISFFV